ncbi:MAG: type II toxin-antitoxin system RelE/ParE family toxin [Gracilimonas sp.]
MSVPKFKISREARNDLNEIWLYTFDNWSREQADRYYNLILSELNYLAENPFAGKSIDHIRKGYRSSKVKFHLIFYIIDQDNKTVQIIRILHEKMDIEARFKK